MGQPRPLVTGKVGFANLARFPDERRNFIFYVHVRLVVIGVEKRSYLIKKSGEQGQCAKICVPTVLHMRIQPS